VIDILVPDEQEGTKAVVRAWLKQVGDAVAVNDPLVELETDKVTQEVPSPAAGVLAEIVLDRDADAVPGALLGRIDTSGSPAQAGAQERPQALHASRPGPRPSPGNVESRLSPSVRRALQQHGIDPAHIARSGRGGRITREDVERALEAATPSGGDIPHDRMRLKIAENMVRAVVEAPHVTALFEADFSAVAEHKAVLAKKGVKLSYTAYIVKAAAEAMGQAPAINGPADEQALRPCNTGQRFVNGVRATVGVVVQDVDAVQRVPIGREPGGDAVDVESEPLRGERGVVS
jgi:2-oxoglutarate dehydrogenase E2 component (dihydrolipoamide succinyltransferase)